MTERPNNAGAASANDEAAEPPDARAWVKAVIEATIDGILVTDKSGRMTSFNPAYRAIWRGSPEIMDDGDHRRAMAACSQGLRSPETFLARIDEIMALAPSESLDVLEFTDGRIVERVSRALRVGPRENGRVWTFRDVTEHRRAQEKSRLTAQRVQLATDAGNLGTWSWSAAEDCISLGPRAEAILGLPVGTATVTRAALEHRVHEADRARVRREIAQALGLRTDFRIDGRMHRPDGELCWVVIRGRCAITEDSAVQELAGVIQDITEQKLSDADLRHSQTRLAMALEAGQMGDWEWDVAAERVHWSPTLEALHGLPPGGFGGSFEDFKRDIHPEDLTRVLENIRESLTRDSDYRIEYRIVKPDGTTAWIEARGKLFRDSQGAPERLAGICMDVTARKQAEEALRESETRFRRMADALREESTVTEHLNALARALATELDPARIAQIVVDAGTRVTRAQFGVFYYYLEGENGATTLHRVCAGQVGAGEFGFPSDAEELFASMPHDEVVRLDYVQADRRFDPSSALFGWLPPDRPLGSCLAVPVSSRMGAKVGRLFFGHAASGVFTDRDEKTMLGIAAQAAAAMETARLYRTEQQARSAAEQANRTKDEFLATLSHELRTPLTPVLMILSDLAADATLPEALAKDLRLMRRNVELEARLIDDLLDLTRIARGKMALHRERVAVGGLIENAIATCAPELTARRLSLRREFAEPSPMIVADGARIMQILWNLLNNAIKFSSEGGEIVVRLGFRPNQAGGLASIEIQDAGRGIEPDRLAQVFDAFEQGPREITRQFGGLGLGLAISRGIAESHGGTISAVSDGPGCGCTFTLMLPADGCEEPPAPTPTAAGAPALLDRRKVGGHPRILLVEDHADTAAVLARMLQRSGYDVLHTTTATDARATAAREARGAGIDIVVSDLRLPDGSGLDLMRDLSAQHGLRGIALSGFGMDADRAQSAAAGFSRHLTKPVSIASVRIAIAEVLSGKTEETKS